MSMSTPLLQGMKILDFTRMLPGPYATMVLADMGAEILKIENPSSPDMVHSFPPFKEGRAVLHEILNRNKKSLALDLKKSENVARILELVKEYDVVIEQFRPGVMDRLGLGYHAVKEVNPSIIYCSISSYGQDSSRAGHDINYLANSGVASLLGDPPSLPGLQIADMSGGMYAALGILAAYVRRLQSGIGEYIDVPITACVASLTLLKSTYFSAEQDIPEVGSDLLDGGGLYDFYETSDHRHVAVGSIEPKFFNNLLKGLGIDHDGGDHLMDRELKEKVAKRIKERPLSHWVEVFSVLDACVDPVLTVEESMSQDPMHVCKVSTPVGEILQIGHPLRYQNFTPTFRPHQELQNGL